MVLEESLYWNIWLHLAITVYCFLALGVQAPAAFPEDQGVPLAGGSHCTC